MCPFDSGHSPVERVSVCRDGRNGWGETTLPAVVAGGSSEDLSTPGPDGPSHTSARGVLEDIRREQRAPPGPGTTVTSRPRRSTRVGSGDGCPRRRGGG